jgi:hypothetical protein
MVRAYNSSLTAHLKVLEQKRIKFTQEEWTAGNNQTRGWNQPSGHKKNYSSINQTRNLFFENIIKIDKPLARRTRGHRDSILINKIRNEKGDKQNLRKSKLSSDPTTNTYTQQNWKTWIKGTIF